MRKIKKNAQIVENKKKLKIKKKQIIKLERIEKN